MCGIKNKIQLPMFEKIEYVLLKVAGHVEGLGGREGVVEVAHVAGLG